MYFEEVKEQINSALNGIDSNGKEIVMWGKGKYALNLLMHTQIINQINFFVDNVCYKDSYFGKKVFMPNEVNWKNVGVVIIAVFYAADEIVEQIKNIPDFSGIIVDTSKLSLGVPFYERESITNVHIQENDKFLYRNEKFKNCCRSKKCYILGNGPSSKAYDLSRLRDEVVFVVNDFFRFDDINKIQPNYYVIKDYAYFNKYIQSLNDIVNVKKYNENIQFFIPIYCYKEKMSVIDDIFGEDVYFYSPTRKVELCTIEDIDITKEIPQIQATIHAAIYIAIYMGYKDIFLVGCEETAVLGCIQMFLTENTVNIHSYNCDDNTLKNFCNNCRSEELSNLLSGFSTIYKNYNIINKMCADGGISLYTCAEETLIKSIKYCSYKDSFL